MKEDKFKNFVDKHRDSFEDYEEDYNLLWETVSAELDKKDKKRGNSFFMKIAASILILLVAGSLILVSTSNDNGTDESISYFPEELAEAAFHYQGMINDRMELIKSSNRDIDQDIFNDLNLLDQAYLELKSDLKDDADNEEVVQAMIQNYKIKLDILEAILDELQRTDEERKDEDNKNDIESSI